MLNRPRQIGAVAIALGLWIGSALCARPAAGVPAALRALTRPVVLPFVWSSLDRAVRDGEPEEVAARGRYLMRLMPDWIDGYLVFAYALAFDASLRWQHRPEIALDRLDASIELLTEALAEAPARADEFYSTMAFFVEARTDRDPRLRAAYEQRHGHAPGLDTLRWSERAEQLRPTPQAALRRALRLRRLIRIPLQRAVREPAVHDAIEATAAACTRFEQLERKRLDSVPIRREVEAHAEALRWLLAELRAVAEEPIVPAALITAIRSRPMLSDLLEPR